jgi:hypothetical protein
MIGQNIYGTEYGSLCPEAQPGISGFFRRSTEDILQRKQIAQPFDMIGEELILQKLFTEKLLIDNESEDLAKDRPSKMHSDLCSDNGA